MKKMSKRILFFGNEQLATGVTSNTPTFRALIKAGYDIAALVITQKPKAKSRQSQELEIIKLAIENDIPVIYPNDLSHAKHSLAEYKAKAAVLIAYGKVVPPEIIDIFPKGIVNIHPSLLPLHRGSTPLESVILSGDSHTGVSLMSLVAEMDAGPIYAQEKVHISPKISKQDLADQLSELGSKMIIEHLPKILDGSLVPKPQNDNEATEDERISKADGEIDWFKPAKRLDCEVRAYLGWPRSRTSIGTTKVIITKAHAVEGLGEPGHLLIQDKQLGVYTDDGVLMIDSLIPAGKKEMSAEAFLAGYKPS
jgi:methionyl-tRNA formyltransferase